MTRVLFVGQAPETVDFSDPSLPPGFNAEKIQAGIDLAAAKIAERGWVGDICMRIPPKGLVLFEQVVNAIHKEAPGAAIAFNTRPEDTAEAAARWLKTD